MYSHTQSSSSDRILGASLAAFSILAVGFSAFVVGYTLTRSSLQENTANANAVVHEGVVPHQGALWQDVGPGVDQ